MKASDISQVPIRLYDFFYHDIATKHVNFNIRMYVDEQLWNMSGQGDVILKGISKIEEYEF